MRFELRPITPGQVIFRELGMAEAAAACALADSTVWRWGQPAPVGTGGLVPSRYHLILLRLAHRLGKKLTAEDLVFGRHK